MHGGDSVCHGAQKQQRLLRCQRLCALFQIRMQRNTVVRLPHGIRGIVRLHQIQHLRQPVGVAQRDKAAVQIDKIETRCFKQDLAPLPGDHLAVAAARRANGNGHVFLHNNASRRLVINGGIQNALAVQRQYPADGIALCQQRIDGQRSRRVCICKTLPAIGACSKALVHIGQAIAAYDLLTHE